MAGTVRYKHIFFLLCIIMMVVVLFTSCKGKADLVDESVSVAELRASSSSLELRNLIRIHLPEASGTVVYEKNGVTIDASHTDQGYIMVKSEQNSKRLKLRFSTGNGTYTYDLSDDAQYETFPLQLGNGIYTLFVFENINDDLYSTLFTWNFDVELADDATPFLYPNQYVSYNADNDAVLYSYYLCQNANDDEARRNTLYRYVADHIAYDYQKAATVQSGYLPDVDDTLNTQKGICFDYSALLACMLRSQNIPTKLVVGYVSPEDMMHAWNVAYINGQWVWMDATLSKVDKEESDYTELGDY